MYVSNTILGHQHTKLVCWAAATAFQRTAASRSPKFGTVDHAEADANPIKIPRHCFGPCVATRTSPPARRQHPVESAAVERNHTRLCALDSSFCSKFGRGGFHRHNSGHGRRILQRAKSIARDRAISKRASVNFRKDSAKFGYGNDTDFRT